MKLEGDDRKWKRGRGRPRWSGVYTDKCDVRLSDEESNMLDRLSNIYGETRSTVMRRALYDFYLFNMEEDSKE